MDHSRSAQLDPTGVLADTAAAAIAFETAEIKLGTWFSEGEVRRSKPRHGIGTVMH
jgi:hypothetical protein